jgi:hypothetical protein
MTTEREIQIHSASAYKARDSEENQRGKIRVVVSLDYLKGGPIAEATLSVPQALSLISELSTAVKVALTERSPS